MNDGIDGTHDPALLSWVESANDPAGDFPIQNLPFGTYTTQDDAHGRPAVAIGDQLLDLWAAGIRPGLDLATIMAEPAAQRRSLRGQLSAALRRGSPEAGRLRGALRPREAVAMALPCPIGDYTDFYAGIHHARAVGALLRPENPLPANYLWVPIGYHGRSSTVLASGRDFRRPQGQVKAPEDAMPRLAPTARLDFELELGVFVATPNVPGSPIGIEQAEEHVFGLVLLNDWSARDVQMWEYVPLGPFLAKNFATSISPWIVTIDALAPFRTSFARAAGQPEPLPYLRGTGNERHGALSIDLEVRLQTARMRTAGEAPVVLSRSNFARAAYWTIAQLLTHHTVNGCALRTGDLLGTGTLSGPHPGEAGSLLELTEGGRRSIRLPDGEERGFLQDGDTITLRGRCAREGFRSIGFGECSATVLPS